MPIKSVCDWCPKLITIDGNKNYPFGKFCSQGCRDADSIFRSFMSDEEINRKNHYVELTKGEDNDST